MVTAYSPIFRIAEMVPGGPEVKNAWGAIQTASVPLYEQGAAGVISVSIAGMTTYSLTTANNAPDQARYALYSFTGALAGDCTVTAPNVQRIGKVTNVTTGGHNIILSTGAGTKAIIPSDGFVYDWTTDGSGNTRILPTINFSQFAPFVNPAGHIDLPGGVTINWGNASSGVGIITISFAKAFSSTPFAVLATLKDASNVGPPSPVGVETTTVVTNAGFNAITFDTRTGNLTAGNFFWFAIGPT